MRGVPVARSENTRAALSGGGHQHAFVHNMMMRSVLHGHTASTALQLVLVLVFVFWSKLQLQVVHLY